MKENTDKLIFIKIKCLISSKEAKEEWLKNTCKPTTAKTKTKQKQQSCVLKKDP